MSAYVEVARATSSRGEVVLRERHEGEGSPPVLELRVNGVYAMDTHHTLSEQRLAAVALAEVASPRDVLVGGLGLGFTARAVLDDGRVERLVVVEVEECLVRWLRDGTVPHGPSYLGDERLRVLTADIAQVVDEAEPASYDLVLLDVDNGPDHLVHTANAAIYGTGFLTAVAAVLRPGGAVAVWSASAAPRLAEHLTDVFGSATTIATDVRLQQRVERYWLYLARR